MKVLVARPTSSSQGGLHAYLEASCAGHIHGSVRSRSELRLQDTGPRSGLNSYADRHVYARAYRHAHTHADTKAHRHADCHTYAGTHCDGHADRHAHLRRNPLRRPRRPPRPRRNPLRRPRRLPHIRRQFRQSRISLTITTRRIRDGWHPAIPTYTARPPPYPGSWMGYRS